MSTPVSEERERERGRGAGIGPLGYSQCPVDPYLDLISSTVAKPIKLVCDLIARAALAYSLPHLAKSVAADIQIMSDQHASNMALMESQNLAEVMSVMYPVKENRDAVVSLAQQKMDFLASAYPLTQDYLDRIDPKESETLHCARKEAKAVLDSLSDIAHELKKWTEEFGWVLRQLDSEVWHPSAVIAEGFYRMSGDLDEMLPERLFREVEVKLKALGELTEPKE